MKKIIKYNWNYLSQNTAIFFYPKLRTDWLDKIGRTITISINF